MKNLFLSVLIISVCMLSSCSSKEYKLNGHFDIDATGQVYLNKLTLEGLEPLDTTRFVDGEFTFTGKVEIPEIYILFFEKSQDPVLVFVENKVINIFGNSGDFKRTVVRGSKLNETYYKIIKDLPHQQEMEILQENFMRAQRDGDQIAMNSLIADSEAMMEDIKNYFLKSIRDNVDNLVGAYLLIQAFQMISFEEIIEIIDLLNTYLADHPFTVGLTRHVSEIQKQQKLFEQMMIEQVTVGIGKEAPDFTLKDINGKDVSLKSFRGKYVLIDFWASWCPPCREENPNLVKMHKKFGGKNLEIISVSLDESADKWKKAVAEDGLNWTLLIDPEGTIAHEYDVEEIPSTFLVDKEGIVISINSRGKNLEKELEELFK